jgi:hypothetical protein
MEPGVATNVNDNKCCGDEVFTVAGQNELHFNCTDFDFSQSVYLVSLTTKSIHPIHNFSRKKANVISYPPPLLATDLNILHQVFLI